METHFYLLCGLCGVLVHTLIKYQSLHTDAQKANLQLPFGVFLRNDWLGIVLALVAIPVWLLLMPEVLTKYPSLHGYNRISFFMVGMLGSYLLQLVNSRSKDQIRKVVDLKTDIADGKDDNG